MLLIVWWVSVVWLALAAGLVAYWFSKWLIDYGNPYRYEYIEAAIVLLYSWPAGLGVIVSGVTPQSALSPYKRIGGIALLALCIATLLVFDYLQAKYR